MSIGQDIVAFKAAYPEFATDSDATIAAVFNTADVFLESDTWIRQRDFAKAQQLWVAHILTLKNMLGGNLVFGGSSSSSTTTTSGGLTDLFVRSIKIGERLVSFDRRQLLNTNKASQSTGAGPGEDNLLLTLYGNLFLQLRQRNFPLVVVL